MVRTVRHFWPDFNRWLDEIPDPRFQPYVIYHRRLLTWYGLSLFLFKLGSRRQADFELRDLGTAVRANLNRLAETRQKTLPVHQTPDIFLGRTGLEPFLRLRVRMIRRLIRMKALDDGRLEGCFVLAVDGTRHLRFSDPHCLHCLVQRHEKTTLYLHMLLEAKLLTPSGLALSLGTEFEENPAPPGSPGAPSKQDCELAAFSRLIRTLKRDFPQTPFCLSGDSLFACGAVLEATREAGWSYVLTFKQTHLPALWEEFQRLLALTPENVLRVETPRGATQVYRWINDLPYEDSDGRKHQLHAIQCEETTRASDGTFSTTTFAWITDFSVTPDTVARIAMKGGRLRWKIENEGFNLQKNSDLNLEHAYSLDPERLKIYYVLLQIAHLILQLVEQGSLLRHLAEAVDKRPIQLFGSLKNIARRLLEAFRNCSLPDSAFDPAEAGSIQIRLNTC